jgi:transposase, IS6 family
MSDFALFRWRHFEADIILCAVRWYLRDALSYRDVEELLRERGVCVDHTTVFRWVQRYAPELDKRYQPHLNSTNDSSRIDETYIKSKKPWHDLYRAVDSQGQTRDLMLSPTRDADAAERFVRQVLQASPTRPPCAHRGQKRGLSTGLRGPSAGGDAPRDLSSQAMPVLE